jgi:hypothetical protein
MATTGR